MIFSIIQGVLFVIIIYKVINLTYFLGKNIKQNNIQLDTTKEESKSNEMTAKFEKKVILIILLTVMLVIIQLVNIMI